MTQQQHKDDGRFKVAAATAAVVPFHCVVCFDEFSLKERPPVVLPCGHTYICAPCSKRLKRCMECREPLFINLKHNTPNLPYNASRAPILPAPTMYGRYSPTPSTPPQQATSTNQQSVQQIPLAMPKNVVLICMMEAAERQMRDANKNISGTNNGESILELMDDTNGSMNASDEDEEYDLNRIISGMATFSGPCGTYVVKDRDGLSILNQYPSNTDENDDDEDEEEDSPIDYATGANANTALHVTASYDSIEVSNPRTLERGQTVQVVRFENGVATLAREAGFVKANSSQLVKGKRPDVLLLSSKYLCRLKLTHFIILFIIVGGPLEKTCRLEGLLDTVISRGKDLQREFEENNRIEETLRREIKAEMQVAPQHPVITAMPNFMDEPTTPKAFGMNNEIAFGTPNESPLTEPNPLKKSTDLSQYQIRSLPHSPSDSNDATPEFRAPGLPAYRTGQASGFDEESMLEDYGCGAAILGNSAFRLFTSSSAAVEHQPTAQIYENQFSVVAQTNSYGNTSGRFRSMSSDAHHHHHGDLGSTSSFDAIDFRTGMSGHRGLNKSSSMNTSKAHTSNHYGHQYGHHSPTAHAGSRFMMSEHRGIARVRGPLQKIYAYNTSTP